MQIHTTPFPVEPDLERPEVYVREMLADWHAANRTYDTEPLQIWLDRKWGRMNLHVQTVEILRPLAWKMGLIVP
jgi:FAD/FMN-containing dehydrogenase